LLDSVEFGKVKLKSDFKNLHNYLKINILAKKGKNTEGVSFKICPNKKSLSKQRKGFFYAQKRNINYRKISNHNLQFSGNTKIAPLAHLLAR
jgi:hypothetical protein